MKQRILAIFLSLCMMIGLLPATAFAADGGELVIGDSPVIITDGGNSQGNLVYDEETASITASAGDGVETPVAIGEGEVVIVPECICATEPGSLTMITESQSLTTIDGEATLELEATYSPEECVLSDGSHGEYENISYEITKVMKNEQSMSSEQYADIAGNILTVYGDDNEDPYTVYVRAKCGDVENEVYSDEIAITVNTFTSAFVSAFVSNDPEGNLDIADGELDISKGSIIITDDGYQVGESSLVEWSDSDHALTITQDDPETPIPNCIHVLTDAKITLKGLNLNGSMLVQGTENVRGPFYVNGNVTVDIILEGSNTLTSTGNPGLEVAGGASINIQVPEGKDDTYGTLTATGGNNHAGIGSRSRGSAGKSIHIKSGNIIAQGKGLGADIGGAKGYAVINEIFISGGHITCLGDNPVGYSQASQVNKIEISGGYMEASGVGQDNKGELVITGGTVITRNVPGLAANTVSITGGNIGNGYTGAIEGRTLTKLAFFDAEGNPQINTEVTVTEGEGAPWTALTDSEGKITTYLADSTTKIMAKVGDGEETEVTIADGLGVVGAKCTCADNPGTLTMTTPSQSLTTINGTATLSGLAATYTKGDCVLQAGFHGAYETNISYEITKVVKNGQYMVVDHYAEINNDTLTVYGETNKDSYTVYIRAVSGPADSAPKAYSKEIAITVNTNVSEADKFELDISDGSIIITNNGYKQGGGEEMTWSEDSHALTITQSNPETPVSNYIDVQSGTAEITLKGVNISCDNPFKVSNSGTDVTVILEGSNTLKSTSSEALQINNGCTVTIKVPDGKDDDYGSLTATGGSSESPGIGGSSAGTLNIKSGKIKAVAGGGNASGIGPHRRSSMTAINISGGHIINQGNQPLGNTNTSKGSTINISGGYIETGTVGGTAHSGTINLTISGGTIVTSKTPGIVVGGTTVLSITGGNIGNGYTGAIEGHQLTKLYFVESNGTPKANMEVTVTEGTDPDANSWTALTDENGVITTYLANATESITVNYESSGDVTVKIPKSHQALIGGDCSCSTFTEITWETGLPKEITLHNLTAGEEPVSMNYDVPAAELVTDQPCNMPIHPSLLEITYELSVTTNEEQVAGEDLTKYASFVDNHLTLLPGNAPYTVTLTAKAGEGDTEKTVSHSITVNKGETSGEETGEISTINLTLGDAVINYTADGKYTYTQGTTITNQAIEGTILITGFKSEASVTVNGGSPTLIINQNDPNDEWTIYSGENAGNITLQPRTFNNKLRFGAVGSTMPELGYVSAAPKLKLNPDQGDISFHNDGSVTQGKFTITQLKDNEEIAIWGADLDYARTITNHTGAEYTIKINGEDITLEDDGTHTISQAKYANQNETNPSTKTYIFDNGSTYALIAVGEGDASAPALANEEQEKISKALLDDDFSGTLYAGGFLFYVGLSELHAEQFSDIQVYTSTLGHVYLGAGLTDLSWGNYCATTGFTVDSENPYFTTDEKGVLYSKDYSTLYVIPSRLKGDYTTHADCTTVNANATMMIALDSLTLGKNVSSVTGGSGSYIFFANNMKAINVEAGNPYFASKDGILYDKDMTIILACPRNVQLPNSTLVVPETVTYVEEYIFSGVNIQKLVIPEGANISGGRGFYRMTALSEIQLLGSYGSTIAESDSSRMDQLAKVTVHDGFDFSGDTFKYSSMEWISSANITVTGGDAPYDGQERSVIVTTDDNELKVEYSTDGDKWSADAPAAVSAPGTYTVYWRITKPADDTYDFDRVLYSSRTFTIGGLEASEDWFTLSGPVTVDAAAGTTPVTLHQPAGAPSLDNNGYIVRYSKEGTGNPAEEKPTEAGTYLVTVEITADGYVEETLTLGNYVILSADQTNSKVISFVTNGGDSIAPIIAASDGDISTEVRAINPTRAGYTFAGWYSDSALRNKVDSLPTTMPSEHTTYYAKWTRDAYKITYELNGGTATGNPDTYTAETSTFTLKNPTKPGYEFTGWTGTGLSGSTKEVTIEKGSSGKREYTANWEKITYTIDYPMEYDRVEGNGTEYTMDESKGITLTKPADRDGYTFKGWTMVIDGSISYILPAENAVIPMGTLGDLTLSGIWMANDQILTLHANGGQFADGAEERTITGKYDSSFTLTEEPTRQRYVFSGWFEDEGCTKPFSAETMPLSMDIYAGWTVEKQTLTLHANGGVFADGTDTMTISEEYGSALTLTKPARSGYTFLGWFIDEECTEAFLDSTMPDSMDIYAGWKKKSSSSSESTEGSGTSSVSDHVVITTNSGKLTDSQIEEAVKKAEKDSVITIQAVKSDEVVLSAGAMEALVENENDLLIQLRDGEVTLPEKAMKGLIDGAKSSYEIVVSLEEQTSSDDATVSELLEKGAVIFDVTVTVNGKEIHSFDKGLTLAFKVSGLKDMEEPVVLHLLQDGEQESYKPDEISGDTLTIKGIKNLSVFAVLSGSEEKVETENPFVDVFENDYYFNSVLWAVTNGVTAGTSDITFSPDVTVSRAQMVTFLWRAAGSPAAEGSNPFTDVSVSDYYYNAVLWAVANGVTAGTSDTTFSPDAPVSRAQAVTFQWRAAGGPAVSGESFTDIPEGAYYGPAVTWAVANGITSGTGDHQFSPDAPVSRAQAVTFLYRQYK